MTALDASMLAAAIAALLAAFVSAAVVGVFGVLGERTVVKGIVVFAAGLEMVSCVVTPLATWRSAHEMGLRYGAESMQLVFAAPAFRAIAILGVALSTANVAAIALLVRRRAVSQTGS